MSQKFILGALCLIMVPFMQGCDERDVATGVVAGAVVGGTIAAIASDNDHHNHYYRSRYNNYYRGRHVRYSRYYGPRYYGPRYGSYRGGYYRGGTRVRIGFNNEAVAQVKPQQLTAVEKFADFYQMPISSAEVIFKAQQKAMSGDISALATLGLFKEDVIRLANYEPVDKHALYRMSLRTGLSEAHAADVLADFQNEFKASLEAGRLSL